MDAGNQTLLKKNNQRAIIDYIIKNGPISRADLSKVLKISKPTVSANVTELIQMDLLTEIGFSETCVGKKPMLVDFNKDFKYVLALDFISYITRNKISVAVCNLYCEPIFTDNIELPCDYSAAVIFSYVPEALNRIFRKNEIDVHKIGRLVLTAPTSRYDEDHIDFRCMYSGEIINLADVFRPYFKDKIVVMNDINLAALGEKHFGVGKEADSLIFFWAGFDVSAGIILNGELYEGRNRAAGEMEFSWVYNELTGVYCYIGEIASGKGIRSFLSQYAEEAQHSILAERFASGDYFLDTLIDAALKGDEFCQDFGRYMGRTFGQLIANLAYTLDVEAAIIGGEYSRFGDVFFEEIYRCFNGPHPVHSWVKAPLYTNSAIYGAFKFGADSIIAGLI